MQIIQYSHQKEGDALDGTRNTHMHHRPELPQEIGDHELAIDWYAIHSLVFKTTLKEHGPIRIARRTASPVTKARSVGCGGKGFVWGILTMLEYIYT